jgi:formate-dependent nitrite reductase membrane component NrfD
MTGLLGQWRTWLVLAIAIQTALVLPYLGEETCQEYRLAELVTVLVYEVGIVGGCMFRAGMLFARSTDTRAPDEPSAR